MDDKIYGTIPKWVWNVPLCEIHEEEIDFQFKGFSETDKNSGVMIVLWKYDGYMSDEYFMKIEWALKAAEKYGLYIMLWDENGFPSGGCDGLLMKYYPQYCAKILNMEEYNVLKGDNFEYKIDSEIFLSAAIKNKKTNKISALDDYIKENKLSYIPESDSIVYIFKCETTNSSYMCYHGANLVDYLNVDAVRKLIEFTHENYYGKFKKYFGTVIKYAFYDEPSLYHVKGGRIWTSDFNKLFIKEYGFSPSSLYPALYFDIGEDTARARNLLFGFRAKLYAESYVKTLADWCNDHNITLTGHMDQEEIINPCSISGDLMGVFKYQPIPGVDEIMEYGRGSKAYKLISSAAENYGRERVMCEVFGAMGEDMNVSVLYKELIDMICKGINFFVPHGTWYNINESRVTFPPELSFRSIKFAEPIKIFNEKAKKYSALLAPLFLYADIAVLYPINDLFSQYHFTDDSYPYDGGINPDYSDYFLIGEKLSYEIRHDFIYIHPDVLDNNCYIENGKLVLENNRNKIYINTIIIPGMKIISEKNIEKIRDFKKSGGFVITSEILPEENYLLNNNNYVCSILSEMQKDDKNGYYRHLENLNMLNETLYDSDKTYDVYIKTYGEVINGNLSYIHKYNSEFDLYLFGNSSDNKINIIVDILGKGKFYIVDIDNTENGFIFEINTNEVIKKNNIYSEFELVIEPLSVVIVKKY